MDRLKTELLIENSIIKFRQIFPPQVWLTPTQEQRCCRVFSNLLTKSNICKIMFVQQSINVRWKHFSTIWFHLIFSHSSSPQQPSDFGHCRGRWARQCWSIWGRCRPAIWWFFAIVGWVESCLSFWPPLSRKGDAQSQSWCCQKCPTLEINFDQLILQSQYSSVIPRMVHLCTKPSAED